MFTRDEVPSYKLYEIVVDSADPAAIASWWAEVLGATVQHDGDDGSSWFEDAPHVPFDCFVFATVPEPKTVKNRIHWDVEAADVQALLDHGADRAARARRRHLLARPGRPGGQRVLRVHAPKVTPGAASRVPGMTKWEYLTAPILTHAAKQILDNFGADGWELVQIAPGMNPENLVGYFKRPLAS